MNATEVLAVLSAEVTVFWPRESNGETLFKNAEGYILYSASTTTVFAGPKRKDWKQVITYVYGAEGLVYETALMPYLDAAEIAAGKAGLLGRTI